MSAGAADGRFGAAWLVSRRPVAHQRCFSATDPRSQRERDSGPTLPCKWPLPFKGPAVVLGHWPSRRPVA